MKPNPEYAVSLACRDGYYVPVVHSWERNTTSESQFRLGAHPVRMKAESKAIELARRLQVPFCQSPAAISDALARYVVKMSAGHLPATRLKEDLLARKSVTVVAERYGVREETVRSIRDILATVRNVVPRS
ncbi:MAG TPA: hypothetical protein VER03_22555 [Bryobacteraceae bacterium]|nr:hypothetical protein [Bryobacteraceae bacterium]